MDDLYARLGITPIVNAKGPSTRLSGPPMEPEVIEAMAMAARSCVDIVELQARAAEVVARHTGAEAGLVTCGAAAGLLLGAAACIARLEPAVMARLPDTRGQPDEIVMVRSQRNQYDHAVRTAGGKIVEVGLPDRYAGAGVRDAEAWEIDEAITDRTAAVLWVAGAASRPSLREVVAVAHARGVPVLVDAAAQLPPASNLRRFIAEGADLVAYSGGKAIGGPQASGMLCGRRDLIMSAALQLFDMDYPEGFFTPPRSFIDRERLRGLPRHGVGRGCKVGKEQIAGLLTALELFTRTDDSARRQPWVEAVRAMAGGLAGVNGLAFEVREEPTIPELAVTPLAMEAPELLRLLVSGSPAIHPCPSEMEAGRVVFRPNCFVAGDVERVVGRLRALAN